MDENSGFNFGAIVPDAKRMVGFGLGVPIAYYLVSKLAQKAEERRLDKQLEAAQNEYVSLVKGGSAPGCDTLSDMLLCKTAMTIEEWNKLRAADKANRNVGAGGGGTSNHNESVAAGTGSAPAAANDSGGTNTPRGVGASLRAVSEHPFVEGLVTGGLGGMSVAAIAALISNIVDAKRQRDSERRRKSKKISPDTIVFNVGRGDSEKSAEDCCDGKHRSEGVVVVPCVESTTVPAAQKDGYFRDMSGRFAKRAGLSEAADTAAIFVRDGVKNTVSSGAKLLDFLASDQFGTAAQKGLSATLALGLMGILTSGYLTKKYLHKTFDRPESDEQPERVARVLFKGASAEYEVSPEVALATIGMYRRYIMGPPDELFTKSAAGPAVVPDRIRIGPGVNISADTLRDRNFWNGSFRSNPIGNASRRVMNTAPGRGLVADYIGKKLGVDDFRLPDNFDMRRIPDLMDEYENALPVFMRSDKGIDAGLAAFRSANGIGNAEAPDYGKILAANNMPVLASLYKENPGLASSMYGSDGSRVGGVLKDNPDAWMTAIGRAENKDVRDYLVNNALSGMADGKGFVAWLMRVPWIRDLVSRYYTGTTSGQRSLLYRIARDSERGLGMGHDDAVALRNKYSFGKGGAGWTRTPPPPAEAGTGLEKPGSVKTGGVIPSLETIANLAILTDDRNKDLAKKMDDRETVTFKRRKKGAGNVSVEVAPDVDISDEDMRRLVESARKVLARHR